MTVFVKIFYISIFRTINLSAVTDAVARVTNPRGTRNSAKTADMVSSGMTATTMATEVRQSTPQPNLPKDCSVVITKGHEKPVQRACRAKPLQGPAKNPDHKTLAQLKKPEVQAETNKENVQINVIEDCHVSVDESSYGDWLIAQGIDVNEAVILKSPEPKTAICKSKEEIDGNIGEKSGNESAKTEEENATEIHKTEPKNADEMTGKESVIETDENKGTEICKKEEPPPTRNK